MRPEPAAADRRVAVIVLTYNRVHELLRTVELLRGLPEQPEIIVIDNASTDGTVSALRQRFAGLQIITMATNTGAAGRNAGVRATRRPYIAFADDDTWWEPGSLTRAADLLDAHPLLAVVTGEILVGVDNRLAPACTQMANSPLASPPGLPGAALLGFHAGASMVRRTAFLQAGGYEPRFFLGAEEELLTLDLAAAGWHLAYIDDLVVHHYPSAVRDRPERSRLLLRNSLWVAWLRRPLLRALFCTLMLSRRAVRDRTARLSLLQALRGLPWALRNRKKLPDHVERRLRLLERAGR